MNILHNNLQRILHKRSISDSDVSNLEKKIKILKSHSNAHSQIASYFPPTFSATAYVTREFEEQILQFNDPTDRMIIEFEDLEPDALGAYRWTHPKTIETHKVIVTKSLLVLQKKPDSFFSVDISGNHESDMIDGFISLENRNWEDVKFSIQIKGASDNEKRYGEVASVLEGGVVETSDQAPVRKYLFQIGAHWTSRVAWDISGEKQRRIRGIAVPAGSIEYLDKIYAKMLKIFKEDNLVVFLFELLNLEWVLPTLSIGNRSVSVTLSKMREEKKRSLHAQSEKRKRKK